jgi:hypothetical protein
MKKSRVFSVTLLFFELKLTKSSGVSLMILTLANAGNLAKLALNFCAN